ncbi:MAG: hypothetical protein FJX75_06735 [Armatimonadetes bacterium]|nr:hypothetical protein [Armatimonadota bacterium]
MRLLTLILLAVLCLRAFAQDAPANLIPDGGFEVDTDNDGMADGWRFSGDQGVKVTWARDVGIEGKYCQKLDCTAFERSGPASHVMLAMNDGFALQEGQWYALSFQVKGKGILGSAIQVMIQQTGPWENLGCEASFRVGPDWKAVETTFRATKTLDRNLRLQIWFASTGTIWIDDVKMVPTKPVQRHYTEVLPDLGSKNLIPNASFECGTSGWGSITQVSGWGGNLNSLFGEIDSTTASRHGCSLKIALDRETAPVIWFDYFEMLRQPVLMPLAANRGWISVTPGADYTLSADVKSDPPGTPVKLRVYQAFGGTLDKDLAATGEWQRVSFGFKPNRSQLYVALGPDLTKSDLPRATLWIDGVQLEKATAPTDFEPRAAVEVGVEWPAPGHLFAPEKVEATVIAFNSTNAPQTAKLQAKVTDFADQAAGSQEVTLTAAPGASARGTLRPELKGKGFFRMALSCEGGTLIPTRPERFAVIEECKDKDGLFGMNHAYPVQELNRLSKQFGLTWFRDWSLKWLHVEPEKGRFDFAEADRQIDRVLELGINVLPLLPFPSSDWGSSAPDSVKPGSGYPANRERAAYMPRDMEEFANYVRTTVTRYKDRLHVWEILNEPVYTSYALPREKGYTPADYVKLLEVAYKAVKEADPKGFVIGGIAGHPDTYTKELIEAGGLNSMDALNVHTYPGLQAPEGYVEPLRKLRKMMADAGKPLPIWFTEGAYYADDDMPWEPFDSWMTRVDNEILCAAYQVRFDAILLAFDTEKIIYHSGTPGSVNNEGVDGIFFEFGGAPRKMVASQAQLTAMLGPDTKTLGVLSEDPWACGFHSRGKTVVVLWTDRSDGPTIAAPQGARLLDICGNEVKGSVTLGEIPDYLVMEGTQSTERVKSVLAALTK